MSDNSNNRNRGGNGGRGGRGRGSGNRGRGRNNNDTRNATNNNTESNRGGAGRGRGQQIKRGKNEGELIGRGSNSASSSSSSSRVSGSGFSTSTLGGNTHRPQETDDVTNRNQSSSSSSSSSTSTSTANGLPAVGEWLLKKEFRHQHDMRKFLLALLCEQDKDRVVQLLASRSGLQRLRDILQQNFTLQAGNHGESYSFQGVVLPLCSLLAHEDLSGSVHSIDLRRLYAAVDSEALFFPRIVACLDQLVSQPALLIDRRATADALSYVPTSLLDVVEPLCQLVLLLLTRLNDAPADDKWLPVIRSLRHALNSLPPPASADRRTRDVRSKFDRCEKLIEGAQRASAAAEEARIGFLDKASERLALSMQTGAEIPLEDEPPPGELRDGGPRHDNDDSDFRAIRVLPTMQELLCTELPYLPRQSAGGLALASSFVATPVDRHLDIQFRLLREDMLAPVRRAISSFVSQRALATLQADAPTFVAGDRGRDSTRCALFRQALIEAVMPLPRDGVSFNVSFAQHRDAIRLKKRDRGNFWEDGYGSRLLQPDSLVALVLNAPTKMATTMAAPAPHAVDDDQSTIILCTVLARGRDSLGKGDARCSSLLLKAFSDVESDDLRVLLANIKVAPLANCEHVLVQVRGHFYAGYEPVLRALQRQDTARLPFLERIVPWISNNNNDDDDDNEEEGDNVQLAPAFVNDATRYDLRCIVKPEFLQAVNELSSVAAADYRALRTTLRRFANQLVLDETQIDAFALALSREISLIQGPPGTGKTYVGVQIVKALLSNSVGRTDGAWLADGVRPVAAPNQRQQQPVKPALHPILCICYTNHALDQFLEQLVNGKIVELNQVVRVGGRSRSELLKGRSVRDLSQFSKKEGYDYFQLKKEMERLEDRVSACQRLVGLVIGEDGRDAKKIESWLREYASDLFNEITSGFDVQESSMTKDGAGDDSKMVEEEKFTIVGGFDAQVRNWLQCSELKKGVDISTERQRRLTEWRSMIETFQDSNSTALSNAIADYDKAVERLRAIDDQSQLRVLRSAAVVGFTTTGAAKYDRLLHALRARVVVCEEAGEVFESHVLAALTSSAQSLVLIGDHQQLRPKPAEYSLSVETKNGYDLDVSMFERLINKQNLDHVTLNTQRRMRREISSLIRRPLYPALLDHQSVSQYPPTPNGFARPLWFLDHEFKEGGDGGDDGSSKMNQGEAEWVCAIVRYVARQGYEPEEIAVLTPYVGQLLLLRKMLAKSNILLYVDDRDLDELAKIVDDGSDDGDVEDNVEGGSKVVGTTKSASLVSRIRLSTVDNFQGEEAKVVIVSTVRSNNRGSTGFLKISNRVNVMLSRAKHGMYILGNQQTLRQDRRATLFHSVLDDLQRAKLIGNSLPLRCTQHQKEFVVTKASDIPTDGGCSLPCGKRKECGHVCRRLCHPDDVDHRIADCRDACTRLIKDCGHACQRLCSQPCGGCTERAKLTLECGHKVEMNCARLTAIQSGAERVPTCTEIVDVCPPNCGHLQKMSCVNARAVPLRCAVQCGRLRADCQHPCTAKCSDCMRLGNNAHVGVCNQACDRALMCGHSCNATPCHLAVSCPPCTQQCNVRCEHSACGAKCCKPCASCAQQCGWRCTIEHDDAMLRCPLPCGSPCARLPCDVRCTRLLSCGHQCPSLCGEQCVDARFCPECAAAGSPSTADSAEQVVDMIVQTTLAELDLDEPGCELLLLRCGHALTRETLDGICKLRQFYEYDDKTQRWVRALPLDSIDPKEVGTSMPACPLCRAPIVGIRRYGRVLNWFTLVVIQRKWQIDVQQRSVELANRIAVLGARFDVGGSLPDKSLRTEIEALKLASNRLSTDANQDAPTRRLFEREQVAAQNTGTSERDLRLIEPLDVPPLIAGDISLRSLQLQLRCICLNFIVPQKKKQQRANNKNSKATNSSKIDDDNDDNDHNGDGLQQLKIVERLLADACALHERLARQCIEASSAKRLATIHSLFARLLLHLLDDVKSIDVSSAQCNNAKLRTVREIREWCVERLEQLLNLGSIDRVQFARLIEEARKSLSDVRYEAVSNEERQMLFKAMSPDIGSGIGSYGGHWYTCPNGHIYTIGECGGAMQESTCPECGARIGGSNHSLATGNRAAEEFRAFVN